MSLIGKDEPVSPVYKIMRSNYVWIDIDYLSKIVDQIDDILGIYPLAS